MDQKSQNLTLEIKNSPRYPFVDQLRGIAVILMVIFHFCFDLNFHHFISINIFSFFWRSFASIIIILFLFTVGMSLVLAHTPKIQWKKFFKRFALLCFLAIFISISTYCLFPKNWIFFGVLHCIAFCSIATLPFLKRPKLSLIFALFIIIFDLIFNFERFYPSPTLSGSLDFIPPLPWLAYTLLGIFYAHYGPYCRYRMKITFLEFLGRHSLIIYILHQPIIFGCVWALNVIIQSSS